MNRYKMVELGTLIKQAKNVRCGNGDYPVLSMTMHDGLVFQDDKFKKVIASKDRSDYKVVKRNQLVISFPIDEGVLATQRIVDAGIVSPAYGIWDVDQEKILPEFLEYSLRCERAINYYKSKLRGSTARRRSLPTQTLLAFKVPLPEIFEQIRILEVIHKVEKILSDREQQILLFDDLVRSRFIELFGDPKLNDKGWKSGAVSDYFDVKGGKRIPKGMGYSDRKTNHPYLRATDMKNETIIEDDIHYIDEDVFQHIKRYTVKGGDIYLTNVGVNLGMAGVIPQKFDGASLTENAVKLVPKTEKVIDGLFLAHYINSPGIQEYINERKMSVGVPKLAIFRIETMPLLIPPIEVQQDFNTFVEQTDKSKSAVRKAIDELETLKKKLMQEYFG